jgi:hypothetical protein
LQYIVEKKFDTPLKMDQNWHSEPFFILNLKIFFIFFIFVKILKFILEEVFHLEKGLECQFWSIFNGVPKI